MGYSFLSHLLRIIIILVRNKILSHIIEGFVYQEFRLRWAEVVNSPIAKMFEQIIEIINLENKNSDENKNKTTYS